MDLFERGMFVKKAAWHGKGRVVQDWSYDFDTARELAGIDFEIGVRDIVGIDGWHEIYRTDTDATIWVAPDTHRPVSVNKFGQVVDVILEVEKDSAIDALTVLDGGRSMTATVYLPEPITVPGDDSPVYPWVNVTNRNDGRAGLRCGPGMTRIVCSNTQQIAEDEMSASGLGVTFRHTAQIDVSWDSLLEEVRTSLRFARQVRDAFSEQATALAKVRIDTERFVKRWLPIYADTGERTRNHLMGMRTAFREALVSDTSVGNDSAWSVLQAVQEADQHSFASRSQESLIRRQWRGGSKYAVEGRRVLLDMAGMGS